MHNNSLSQFTEKFLNYLEKSDFSLKENIPDFIDQLLKFKLMDNILSFTLGILILLFIIFLIRKIIKLSQDNRIVTRNNYALFLVILIPWALWFFTEGINNIRNIIKIQTAPKVFILDYLKSNPVNK